MYKLNGSKKMIVLLALLIVLVVIALIMFYKIMILDSFSEHLEAELTIESYYKEFPSFSKINIGEYVVLSTNQKKTLQDKIGKTFDSNRDIIALRGAEILNFKAKEFHGVKGNLVVKKSRQDIIYIYSFNARFVIMVDIPIEAIDKI
jgi:hypothetical protein